MMSLLTLLFVAGCAEQKPEQTTAETTTESPVPVALEGEWQAIDFRDTLERTFLYTYKDAYTRLKVTEAFEDVSPTLTIEGTKVTYTYTADMNKYFEFYSEANKDKIKDKAEAAKVLAALAQKKSQLRITMRSMAIFLRCTLRRSIKKMESIWFIR